MDLQFHRFGSIGLKSKNKESDFDEILESKNNSEFTIFKNAESFMEKENMDFVLNHVDEAIFRIQSSEHSSKNPHRGFKSSRALLSHKGEQRVSIFKRKAEEHFQREFSESPSKVKFFNEEIQSNESGTNSLRSPKKRNRRKETNIHGLVPKPIGGPRLIVDIQNDNKLKVNFKALDEESSVSEASLKRNISVSLEFDKKLLPEAEPESFVRMIPEKVMPNSFFPEEDKSLMDQLEFKEPPSKKPAKNQSFPKIFSKIKIAHKLQQK